MFKTMIASARERMQQNIIKLKTQSEKLKTQLISKITIGKKAFGRAQKKLVRMRTSLVKVGKWFLLGVTSATIVGGILGYGVFLLAYRDKVFPGVKVGGVNISGLNLVNAEEKLVKAAAEWESQAWPLEIRWSDNGERKSWEIKPEEVDFSFDMATSLERAWLVGRSGSVKERLIEQIKGLVGEQALAYSFNYDRELFKTRVATMAAEVNQPAVPPALEIVTQAKQNRVVVKPGESGKEVNQEEIIKIWEQRLGYLNSSKIDFVVDEVMVAISEEEAAETQKIAEQLLDKELTLTYTDEAGRESQSWVMTNEDLLSFLSFRREENSLGKESHIDEEKVKDYVVEIAKTLDRPAQNAILQFDAGSNRVVEFKPAKDGLVVDQEKVVVGFMEALSELETEKEAVTVSIVVKRSKPEVANEEVNNLGIKELLGRGVSTFYGSIPGRVHNVILTAQRLNGTLVKPGETFSFNAAIGEVSAATGYQPAYIIRSGRTELDDGGGVCQDSTTTFRAALDAGLPIVERQAHAYRVGYYEQNAKPGLDATVYAPRTDLKFKNDTPGHLLIQAYGNAGTKTLVVEIYGTSDGRKSEILNHKIWDVSPPPPDLYQDDPSLPAGTIKQVDWKAWGAKVKYDYRVTRGTEVIYEKTFYSYFKPWQAVFLRGTGG